MDGGESGTLLENAVKHVGRVGNNGEGNVMHQNLKEVVITVPETIRK